MYCLWSHMEWLKHKDVSAWELLNTQWRQLKGTETFPSFARPPLLATLRCDASYCKLLHKKTPPSIIIIILLQKCFHIDPFFLCLLHSSLLFSSLCSTFSFSLSHHICMYIYSTRYISSDEAFKAWITLHAYDYCIFVLHRKNK